MEYGEFLPTPFSHPPFPSAAMKRILVSEYLSSGALANCPVPASLRREGLAMLQAVSADLVLCPGVEVVALLDPILLSEVREGLQGRGCLRATGNEAGFVALAVQGAAQHDEELERLCGAARPGGPGRPVDAALVIAPEFGGLLEQRCRQLEEWGVPLLGCGSEAVRLTADKLILGQLWQQAGVRTPAVVSCQLSVVGAEEALSSLTTDNRQLTTAFVLKPRDGAGSQATFLLRGPEDLPRAIDQARVEGWSGDLLVQPFVPGQPASVALLLGDRDPGEGLSPSPHTLVLPACRQVLSDDGRFRYLGGELPLPASLSRRASRLALQAISPLIRTGVSGLRGYVGVDLILGQAEDGSEDQAIEINPRLTTSYVGLRTLARFNLAQAWLALLGWDLPLPRPDWYEGPVRFQASS